MELLLLLGGLGVLVAGWKKAGSTGQRPASWADSAPNPPPTLPNDNGVSYVPQSPAPAQSPAPWALQFGGGARTQQPDLLSYPSAQPVRMSWGGRGMLKDHEGWSPVPYRDDVGKWTIGYGHLIQPGERFTQISGAQGEEILSRDLRTAEAAVSRYVRVPLTQEQFDALVSFTFNLGADRLRGSTLLRKLNAGDYEGAADEFRVWNKGTVNGRKVVLPGLTARREDERERFLRGTA